MTLQEITIVSELIIAIRGHLAAVPDNVRKNAWDRIMSGYCKHCGTREEKGKCHCENDE